MKKSVSQAPTYLHTNDDDTKKSYMVGYGRPPVSTRFQKGESGNPKGKAKGQLNLKSDLMEELKTRVAVVDILFAVSLKLSVFWVFL